MAIPSFEDLLSQARAFSESESETKAEIERSKIYGQAFKQIADFLTQQVGGEEKPRTLTGAVTPEGVLRSFNKPVSTAGVPLIGRFLGMRPEHERLVQEQVTRPAGQLTVAPGAEFTVAPGAELQIPNVTETQMRPLLREGEIPLTEEQFGKETLERAKFARTLKGQKELEGLKQTGRVEIQQLKNSAKTEAVGKTINPRVTDTPLGQFTSDYIYAKLGLDPIDSLTGRRRKLLTYGEAQLLAKAENVDLNAELRGLGYLIQAEKGVFGEVPQSVKQEVRKKVSGLGKRSDADELRKGQKPAFRDAGEAKRAFDQGLIKSGDTVIVAGVETLIR